MALFLEIDPNLGFFLCVSSKALRRRVSGVQKLLFVISIILIMIIIMGSWKLSTIRTG